MSQQEEHMMDVERVTVVLDRCPSCGAQLSIAEVWREDDVLAVLGLACRDCYSPESVKRVEIIVETGSPVEQAPLRSANE